MRLLPRKRIKAAHHLEVTKMVLMTVMDIRSTPVTTTTVYVFCSDPEIAVRHGILDCNEKC